MTGSWGKKYKGKYVGVLFIDLLKAFDITDYNFLVAKLKA